MYNVEKYLSECLDTLLAQTYTNLEIILVDDGSTDSCPDIARTYIAADRRVSLIQKKNAGLGAARNTGIAASKGEYLVFLDSDDTLPLDAYERMMRAILESGSDLVVGSHVRNIDGSLVEANWSRRVHATRTLGVTIEDAPDMLIDIFAWNKIFSREFWDRAELSFPEGVRYEDQVPMTQAYLDARVFDVIPAVVYRHRIRDDGSSISQQKREAADLHDRLATKRAIAKMMDDHGCELTRRRWFVKVFTYDLLNYYRAALTVGDDYWELLSSDVAKLLDQAPSDIWDSLEIRHRVPAWLVSRGMEVELERFLAYADAHGSNFRVIELDGALHVDLPLSESVKADAPDFLARVNSVDVSLQSRLRRIECAVPGEIELAWFALLRHIDPHSRDVRTTLRLREQSTGRSVTTNAIRTPDQRANVWATREHENHDLSAFTAVIKARDLLPQAETSTSVWDVFVAIESGEFEQEGPFQTRLGAGSAGSAVTSVIDGALMTTEWSQPRGLSVTLDRRYAVCTSAHHDGNAIDLIIQVPPGERLHKVFSAGRRVATSVISEVPSEANRFRVSLPVVDIELADEDFVVLLADCGWDEPVRIMPESPLDWVVSQASAGKVACVQGIDGSLTLVARRPLLLIEGVSIKDDSVSITGTASAVEAFTCEVAGPRAVTGTVDGVSVDGSFHVTVPLTRTIWGHEQAMLPRDPYQLRVTSDDGRTVLTRCSRTVQGRAPIFEDDDGWTSEVDHQNLELVLRRDSGLPLTQASRFAQQRLQTTTYAAARLAERSPTVLFECFNGAGTGDSPGAVCDYLLSNGSELDVCWSVNDLSVPVPDGSRAVLRLSKEWYQLLGSAKFLVSNNNFPAFFKKAEDQVHVQTWHGTPLKKIGHDVESAGYISRAYMDLMDAEARGWDYLVSPSPFCSEIFPAAFAYYGEILEIGYPRNDALLSAGAAEVRQRVRSRLGVPDDQQLLLYAPTWRENVRVKGRYGKVVYLESALVTEQRDDVTVLVRGHANTSSQPLVAEGKRMLDVTSYPDIAELYLAADVLVTDYSSVMFDFALTDKPMIFLVPDIDEYRDKLRGFYFDFEQQAPGPLVDTTEAVIKHLDDSADSFAQAREKFRQRFAPLDDGRATERLVSRVFGLS